MVDRLVETYSLERKKFDISNVGKVLGNANREQAEKVAYCFRTKHVFKLASQFFQYISEGVSHFDRCAEGKEILCYDQLADCTYFENKHRFVLPTYG